MVSTKKLTEYQQKRDFSQTEEPKGGKQKPSSSPIFVVHKHAARRLHYDLRLEDEGVLKSWALPKGPSVDPKKKQLAIQTEDHPLEYGTFEGIIPQGQYGAGEVIIWDTGTCKNLKDIPLSQAIKNGEVTVELMGEKLKGNFALVRTKYEGKPWLFIKMKDGYAQPERVITEELPRSVISGKTVEDLKKEGT